VTRFLASVTGPDEAAIARDGGADVIDLKDPRLGALGAVAPGVVRATVAALDGVLPVSAVAGDLPMEPETVARAAGALAAAGAETVKVGVFPGGDPRGCVAALAPLARSGTKLVAVLFADAAPDLGLLPALAEAGFTGAMLDTAGKGAGGLLAHMDLPALGRFVAAARACGLEAGLAGSLEPPDVPRLLLLRPDVLGFRGALTAGARADGIDAEAVRTIRALIPRADAGRTAPAVDYRLLAARGYAPTPEGDPAVADRVYVRDLVLPVSIGAYARERAAPQRVRFSVTALVARTARPSQDMRDVFSYDIITDGIRLLAASGHFALVETLAEEVATLLLGYPRVVRVTVAVEKLDTGANVVGVEIERQRESAAASVLPFATWPR
jgi:dihydroneopterin aldolase